MRYDREASDTYARNIIGLALPTVLIALYFWLDDYIGERNITLLMIVVCVIGFFWLLHRSDQKVRRRRSLNDEDSSADDDVKS